MDDIENFSGLPPESKHPIDLKWPQIVETKTVHPALHFTAPREALQMHTDGQAHGHTLFNIRLF